LNICVFASGSGTNFEAILNARAKGIINSEIVLLITNNSDCGAVDIARRNSVEVVHISRKKYTDMDNDSYANLFIDEMKKRNVDLIVLAGYMKMLDAKIIRNYRNRIINIHPALLPDFGGKGMYGMNVHRAVISSGAEVSGVTIHFVNENYDEGKIILQKKVDVDETDDEFSLQKKVLALEHKYYSEVIKMIEDGNVKIGNE